MLTVAPIAFALLTLLPGVPAQAAPAPIALDLSVDSAQVGQVLFIEGSGLAGADLQVYVGRTLVTGAINPGGSSQRIRIEVPNGIDGLEPDTVPVKVRVDDVEAVYPNGPLWFTWEVPQPAPSLSGYDTGDPERPHSVLPGHPFVITFTGERLAIGRREPLTCVATSTATTGWVSAPVVRMTKTEASFAFAGFLIPADYQFHVLFSDGSTAAIDAPGFVEPPLFGSAPRIENAQALVGQEQVVCDMTLVVERGLCANGFPGVEAQSPGILLGVTFTALDLQARVTDADSGPALNDVLLVGATPGLEDILFLMPDDGSTASFPFQQTEVLWMENCANTTPDYPGCVCAPATYGVTSNDVTPGDDVYTRRLVILNPTTATVARDCVVSRTHRAAWTPPAGTPLRPRIEAVDRSGNIASFTAPDVTATGSDVIGCTGDPCGCCLLLSSNPASPPPAGCQGLDGMVSIERPLGVCHSF